ncbi:MAG: S8 family serine peptidase [Deltaproteobacteria bacterium]|nr:S8 family serine peptidase [Deltaproteobacteria bacterium]
MVARLSFCTLHYIYLFYFLLAITACNVDDEILFTDSSLRTFQNTTLTQTKNSVAKSSSQLSERVVPGEIIIRFKEQSSLYTLAAALKTNGIPLSVAAPQTQIDKYLDDNSAIKSLRGQSLSSFSKSISKISLNQKSLKVLHELELERLYSKQAMIARRFAHLRKSAPNNKSLLYGVYKISVDPSIDTVRLAAQLQKDSEVLYAEPNYLIPLTAAPNDAYYADELWHLQNLDLETVWNYPTPNNGGYTGNNIVVAVIDSGLDITHEDIVNNLWQNTDETFGDNDDDDGNGYNDDKYGFDFVNNSGTLTDTNGHGTHVAGIIAASGNNSIGVIGVAPRAEIMVLHACQGLCGRAEIIEAFYYAADNGAQVINCSFTEYDKSQLVKDAIDNAIANGVIVVAAAGNDFMDTSRAYPASFEGVIAIGASLSSNEPTWYSNLGGRVDLFVPGGDDTSGGHILSLKSSGTSGGSNFSDPKYYYDWGTSMASPFASGLVALLLERWSGLTNDQVRFLFHNYAIPTNDWSSDRSFGVLNDAAAMMAAPEEPPDLHGYITKPSHLLETSNNYFHKGNQLEIYGVATGADFHHYEIATATVDDYLYDNPNFILRYTGNSKVEHQSIDDEDGGILATINTGTGVSGKVLFIRLRVYDDNQHYIDAITALFRDDTLEQGWPRYNEGYEYLNSEQLSNTLLGDVDGDGYMEIISMPRGACWVYIRRYNGETLISGSDPFIDICAVVSNLNTYSTHKIIGIALADLDKNGDLEIIVAPPVTNNNETIYAFHHDGTAVAGFPAGVVNASGSSSEIYTEYPPVVADLENDGTLDILRVATNGSVTYLVAVDAAGNPKNGFPLLLGNSDDVAFPLAVGDIDGDSKAEIFAQAKGASELQIIRLNETVTTISGLFLAAVLADLNNDDNYELIDIRKQSSNLYLERRQANSLNTIAWSKTDSLLDPQALRLADVDHDGDLEIIVNTTPINVLDVYDDQGNKLSEYSKSIKNIPAPSFANPCSAHCNGLSDTKAMVIAGITGDSYSLFDSDSDALYSMTAAGDHLSGFPKYFAPLAAPALGDIDNDGKLEIAVQAMNGLVYVFELPQAQGSLDWPTFGANNQRTHMVNAPRLGLAAPAELTAGRSSTINILFNHLTQSVNHTLTIYLQNPDGSIIADATASTSQKRGNVNISLSLPADMLDGSYELYAKVVINNKVLARQTISTSVIYEMHDVPDVVHQSITTAQSLILAEELSIGTINYTTSTTYDPGTVLEQDPVAGSSVPLGSKINLTIVADPNMRVVPNVVNQTQTNAEKAIEQANLKIGNITFEQTDEVSPGTVLRQQPVAGEYVPLDATVNLWVATDPNLPMVPNVVLKTIEEAKEIITNSVFKLGTITYESSTEYAPGTVIKQQPLAGQTVAANTSINLVVATKANTNPQKEVVVARSDGCAATPDSGAIAFSAMLILILSTRRKRFSD